jgi:hypothetical protein
MILFVNKFGPKGRAITGKTAHELACFLHSQGLTVGFLSTDSIYNKADKDPENIEYSTWTIRSCYSGSHPILRLLGGLLDAFRLWLRAARLRPKWVVVMTEPPLLILPFQLLHGLSTWKLAYYVMDVYPEAFAARGLISSHSLVFKFVQRIVYGREPDLLIALGSAQAAFLTAKYRRTPEVAIVQCGVAEAPKPSSFTGGHSDAITFCYAGNLGEAHDAEFLLQLAKCLNPVRHHLYVSIYGANATAVEAKLRRHATVSIHASLAHADLASVDINIASLRPQWSHICVPSKITTAICCGCAVLLNATKDTDAWRSFAPAIWLIEPTASIDSAIEGFLTSLDRDAVARKRALARELAQGAVAEKIEAHRQIFEHFSSCATVSPKYVERTIC